MINNSVLVGRLTKDPELRYTPNGVPVATFTLACDRPFTDQSGEKQADFINIVVWRKPAENCANYLKKGSMAGVVGRIQTRFYDKDGKRVYVTEVVSESVRFLDRKNDGGQQGNNTNQNQNRSQGQNSGYGGFTRVDEDPFAGNGNIDISDDDLPF